MRSLTMTLLVASLSFVTLGAKGPTYPGTVLADSPVGYWELNEKIGTVAASATGTHVGTYVGSPSLGQMGLVSYLGDLAPRLDGKNDRITANSMASGISWSRGFTLEVWVRVTQRTVEEHAVAFNFNGGKGNGPAILRDEPTDRFKYRDGDRGSNYHYALSKTVPLVGRTYYVVVTVDGSNHGNLYVNGTMEASFTTPARPPSNGGLFTIGAEYDAGPTPCSFWHGLIDEPAVYNYALSASRIKAHWQAGG
jgi:hypothetical protein